MSPTGQVALSVVIPCKNEGQNLKMTLDSLFAAAPVNRVEYIIVNDGSTDNCCDFIKENNRYSDVKLISSSGLGVSRARNLGAAGAGGKYLVFCDAHITVPAGWQDDLVDIFRLAGGDAVSPAIGALDKPDATGYGQTWNERLQVIWLPPPPQMKVTPVPLLPGGCVAVRRDVFQQVAGFDGGFIAWGHEDVEFSLRLWLFGYKSFIAPQLKILHLFRKKHPYPVKMDHFLHNMLRLAYSHFKNERIEKILKLIDEVDNAEKINRSVLKGGALKQRSNFLARRKHDDDWFMGRFNIPF